MPRLIVFTHADQIFREGETAQFRCAPDDALNYGQYSGQPIIVADITPNISGGYVALGTLSSFEHQRGGTCLVQIEKLQPLAMDMPFAAPPPETIGIAEIDDAIFDRIAGTTSLAVYESSFTYDFARHVHPFSDQLLRQQQRRCSFSDVTTHKGQAVIIRPLDQEGIWHIGNFLFLDPEPGELFSSFAWTIGPRLELIINAYAMTPDIADTVNRSGMLAISDKAITTLDRTALAWHREQFFSRLRA